jgi:deoxyhypusine synthase
VATGSVYVHADVTAIFPWLTYALLADTKMKRKPRRLYDARGGAVSTLKRVVAKRRSKLLPTVAYPVVEEVEAAREGRGQGTRRSGR